MTPRAEDLQATFCATLVDEWTRCGVLHAVVSPGSRSTPLLLALVGDDRIRLHVHQDERSAGFLALGLALAAGEPTVVVTTSGTAAVELHPAVVEADLAAVPLLVCTADRPSELIDVGAPQAIDQTHLFGRSVRWFHAPGVADASTSHRWRALAARAYGEATGSRQGPVHLNLAFREPLVGEPTDLPAARSGDGRAWTTRPPAQAAVDSAISVDVDLAGRRGVIVAGAGSPEGALVDEVASALGWPVLAAPQAPVWRLPGAVIPAADAILRTSGAARLLPEVVLRLGAPLASRVVGDWIAGSGADEVIVAGPGTWSDPHGTAVVVLPVDPAHLLARWAQDLAAVAPVDDGAWLRQWQEAGTAAVAAIDAVLGNAEGPTEPGTARALIAALPAGSTVLVSSSMPIREVEWWAPAGRDVRVEANRGANGIDGIVSTAVGLAVASGGPTGLLIGDVAFLHDSNGLIGAAERGIDLVIVVVDNDGGGIFSFLPQAQAVPRDVFETVYGTPHGLDLVAVAQAFGGHASRPDDLEEAVRRAVDGGGVHVLVVRTDRDENVKLHEQLNAAVSDALAR